jgi:hypothetical protein
MLTMGLSGGSKWMITIGDELTATNSGQQVRKGTEKFRSLGLPLFDSFVLDVHLE